MSSLPKIKVGNAVDAETDLYVKRPEDADFLECAFENPAWLNIYGCRTMGKTSLYTQYLGALSEGGIKGIPIDLVSEVSANPKNFYEWAKALGEVIAARLSLDKRKLLGSLEGLSESTAPGTILEKLLVDGLLENHQDSVMLILDEYDHIRELEYHDEILYAFRHIKALQARNRELARLSVCFVGLEPWINLGTPGDASSSPIAIPIEMMDFTASQATIKALRLGFPAGERPNDAVFRQVLALSGGQPLITMELLRQVKSRNCQTPDDVQRLAENLVAPSGRGKQLQLFERIHSEIIKRSDEAFAPLSAYELLLRESDEAHTAPGVERLLLWGLVRRTKDGLEVKGELFRRRFDLDWVERMFSLVASSSHQYRGGGKSKGKRICVINTGGTLGMVERGKRVVAPRDANEFKDYFTSLSSIAEVEFQNLFPPRDSINIFPNQWATIARYIFDHRKDGFDGFVVAHGTDTMAFTASAVAFALGPQLRFPVVFTGAQTTPDVAYGDAHVNLYRACEVAKKDIPEVVISFGNFVYRAVRAQKKDDRRFDGFESPTYPPLAEITGEITVRQELLRRLPKQIKDIELRADFESSILMVPQFPGLEPGFFDHLLTNDDERQRCRGVIVQTLGAGNVASEHPYSFIPFVRRAYRQGIPVIVTSQYPPDPGTHTKYTPAKAPLNAGAIHAGNMTIAAAVTKFRWVLADVLRRKGWQMLAPDAKKKLVSMLMVEKSVVGEF
jgi:L-asparaginase